jgi:hypothetical protein
MKFKNLFFILLPFISFGQENLSTIVNPRMASSIDFKRIKKPNDKSLSNKELSEAIIKYEESSKTPFFTGVPNFYYNYEIVKKNISADEIVINMLDTRNGDLYDLKNLTTFSKEMGSTVFYNDTIYFGSNKVSLKWNEEDKKFTTLEEKKTYSSSDLDPKLVSSLEKKYKTRFQSGEAGLLQIQGDNIVLTVNGKQMLFDINGKELSKPIYDQIYSYYTPILWVMKDKLYGLLDSEGKTIFPPIYKSHPSDIGGGLYHVSADGGEKIINLRGEEIKREIFNEVRSFKSGLAMVRVGDKCGYIDINGDPIVPKIYKYCGEFSENLANVSRDGKCGYISVDGTEVIPINSFDDCGYFREGLAEIGIKNRKGLIDKTGKIVIQPTYDFTSIFNKVFIKVTKNGKNGLVDRSGNVSIPLIYDEIETTSNKSLFAAKLDGKWGAINENAETIEPFEFNYFQKSYDMLIIVDSNKKEIKRFRFTKF